MTSNIYPMISSSPPPLDDGPGFEDDNDDFGTFASAHSIHAEDSNLDNFADFSLINSNNDISSKVTWESNHILKTIHKEQTNDSIKKETINGDYDDYSNFVSVNGQGGSSDSVNDFTAFKNELSPSENEQSEESGNFHHGKSNRDSGNFSMKSENTEGNRSNRNSGDYNSKSEVLFNLTSCSNSADSSTAFYKSDEQNNLAFDHSSDSFSLVDKNDSSIQSPLSEPSENFDDLSETLCEPASSFVELTNKESDCTQEFSSCSDHSVSESLQKGIPHVVSEGRPRQLPMEDDLQEDDLNDFDDESRFVDVPKLNTQDNSSQDSVTDSGLCSGSQQSDGSPLPSADMDNSEPISPFRIQRLDFSSEENDFVSMSGLRRISEHSCDALPDEEEYDCSSVQLTAENNQDLGKVENVSDGNSLHQTDVSDSLCTNANDCNDCDIDVDHCDQPNELKKLGDSNEEWNDFNSHSLSVSTNFEASCENQQYSEFSQCQDKKDTLDNFANFENVEEFADFSSESCAISSTSNEEFGNFHTIDSTLTFKSTENELTPERDDFEDFHSGHTTEIQKENIDFKEDICNEVEKEEFGEFNSETISSPDKITLQQQVIFDYFFTFLNLKKKIL